MAVPVVMPPPIDAGAAPINITMINIKRLGAAISSKLSRPVYPAVRAETDAYLAGLTPEELDRKVTTFMGELPVGAVLALFIGHQAHHLGEVSALKGAQGVKGLPF